MGALSIPTFEIDATAACMYIGRDASDAHGRACSGLSAWRPASVEAPVAGVDKVSHPDSGFPVRMWLRSWLRRGTVAPRHSRRLCAATGTVPTPFLDAGKSVEPTTHAKMCATFGATGN